MSLLLDHFRTPAGGGALPPAPLGAGVPSPVLAGVLAATQAVTASVVLVTGPVVAAWASAAGTSATWAQAVRTALDAWLLAQHAGIAVEGGQVTIVPLGLTAALLGGAWLAGRRLARTLDPHGERIAAGFGRARAVPAPWPAVAAFVVTWTALAGAVALVAASPGAQPVLWQAVLGAAVLSCLGSLTGSAAWEAGGARAGLRACVRAVPLPAVVRAWLRPALLALGVHVGAAALVTAAALALSAGRVLDVHRALDPGFAGGVALLLAQVAYLPTALVWVAALLVGPGFAVGTGTSVTVAASVLGPLPAVPVLGALPPPGALPGWALALLAVPVAAGVAAGSMLALRRDAPGRLRLMADVAGTALLAGSALGLLAWLSGGAAGPGRLAEVGPRPLVTGVLFAAEVAAGALVALLPAPPVARGLAAAAARAGRVSRRAAGRP